MVNHRRYYNDKDTAHMDQNLHFQAWQLGYYLAWKVFCGASIVLMGTKSGVATRRGSTNLRTDILVLEAPLCCTTVN